MALRLGNLSKLVGRVTQEKRNDLFLSTFIFPKTETLPAIPDLVTLSQPTLDLEAAKTWAKENTELIAINARDDAVFALNTLKALEKDLPLSRYDSIVFYRNCLPIIRLNNGKEYGISMSFDLNEYQRKLQREVDDQKETLAYVTVIAICIIAPAFVFW